MSKDMKRFYYIVIITIIMICSTSLVQAQNQYHKGGFGYGAAGFSYGMITNLETTLQDYDLICTYCNTPQFAWNLGGGGYGLFAKRFVLEGKLYGQIYEVTESEATRIKTTGGFAFVDFGFAVVNQDGWLVYPGIGFGVSGHTMKIKNKTDGTLYFGDDKLHSETQTDFRMGVPMIELKVGLNKMLKDMGRVALGLDLGVMFNVNQSDWKNLETGDLVTGIDQTGFNGIYLNLTIGGGKFLMAK
jgi:hypothetical protein